MVSIFTQKMNIRYHYWYHMRNLHSSFIIWSLEMYVHVISIVYTSLVSNRNAACASLSPRHDLHMKNNGSNMLIPINFKTLPFNSIIATSLIMKLRIKFIICDNNYLYLFSKGQECYMRIPLPAPWPPRGERWIQLVDSNHFHKFRNGYLSIRTKVLAIKLQSHIEFFKYTK